MNDRDLSSLRTQLAKMDQVIYNLHHRCDKLAANINAYNELTKTVRVLEDIKSMMWEIVSKKEEV